MIAAKTVGVLALFALCSVSAHGEAAVIDATSCSNSHVAQAISVAHPGDTVRIPAGTCTWTARLRIDIGITVSGAGVDQTILIDSIPRVQDFGRMFDVAIPNGQFFRLTGLTLQGDGIQPAVYDGTIVLSGCSTSSPSYRIDHNKFHRLGNYGIRTWGSLFGVTDNNVGTTNANRPLIEVTNMNYAVGGVCGSDNSTGDTSWTQPTTLGTSQAHYVESNTWTTEGVPYVMVDSIGGARVVVRHNTMYNAGIVNHGTETGGRQRGGRQMEVYNNTFIFPPNQPVDALIWFRSGTGVAFNNAITADVKAGLNAVVKTNNLRDAAAYSPWGRCDGTSPRDGNQPGATGYRCIDQPGAGTSIDYQGINPPAAVPALNQLDPIYVWANTVNGTPNNCGTYGCLGSGHVQVNRDIYFSARPGYQPFVYPHPLTSGALPAPTNLNVR